MMPQYGGGDDKCTVDDYQELVLQFCFVTLFGAAFPLLGMLALISNIIEVYVDSTKLCHTMRRPLAQRVASIPQTWLLVLKVVAVLSCFKHYNCLRKLASVLRHAWRRHCIQRQVATGVCV